MDEKEKQIIENYKSNLELYKYEKKIGLGRINIDEKIYEMEVIINVIERLQKENEELKKSKITYKKARDIQEKNKNIVDKNYIHNQKIKDKIEELKQKAINYGPFIDKDESFNIESKISVLQELL